MSETCTADHVLLMADAVDEFVKELPSDSHYVPHCTRVAAALRDVAPGYVK